MLVLTRKLGEKIRIGSDIVLHVVAISETQVKIGIDAPSSVKILRDELYENIKTKNLEAAEVSKGVSAADLVGLKINKVKKDAGA